MQPIGMKDKARKHLYAGDKVQIVNGPNSGTVIYKIRASNQPYTIVGDLNPKDSKLGSLEVLSKKVIKL